MKHFFFATAAVYLAVASWAPPSALAQNSSAPAPKTTLPIYDVAHEITVKGSVGKTTIEPIPGTPFGTHLLLNTQSGLVDVHLGPSTLQNGGQLSLSPGEAVEIVGSFASFGNGPILLARTLKAGNRVWILRNEHGIPLAPAGARRVAVPQAPKAGRQ